jgi:arylsulfatase A-like enzyme
MISNKRVVFVVACTSWTLLLCCLVAGTTSGAGKSPNKGQAKAERKRQPHIIFIIMDDLGSYDLGMHGSGIYTPTCDDLARQGVFLSNYYVLPTCSPTRSAILSGNYPLHTGVHTVIHPDSTRGLPLDQITLAQVLSDKAGYTAHAVGKWHVGHSKWEQTPTFRGFDSFFGFYLGGQDYSSHRQLGAYDLHWDKSPKCGDGCSVLVDEIGNYSTHVYTREAISRINEHRKSPSYGEKPLFLYLAYQAVHNPDQVPWKYQEPYEKNTNWDQKRKIYAGMLTAADEGIRNVTQALKDNGMWEDTILIFTTDNGGPTEVCAVQGSSNGPLRGGKCTVWEGGTTGDGFLSGPYLDTLDIPTKANMSSLFHCVDWLPTLAKIAGVTLDHQIDGVNQLQALRGNETARKEVFVGYGFDQNDWYGPAIRVGHWKLIEGSGGPDNRHSEALKDSQEQRDSASQSLRFNKLTNIAGSRNGNRKKRKSPATAYPQAYPDDPYAIYQLYNLEHDKEERNDVSRDYPEITKELVSKLNDYKATYVPEPDEDETCPAETNALVPGFGKVWLPWCSGGKTRQLVVYE